MYIKFDIEMSYAFMPKPIDTHVNTKNSSGGFLEKAISEKTITFYNYDEFNDHKMIVEDEFCSVYVSKWKPRELIITLKHIKVHNKYFDKKIVKEQYGLMPNSRADLAAKILGPADLFPYRRMQANNR
ncbi:12664_t:CDS:2 [Gigaspora margarita]|uniref:12664_t:CDS:1 n=1 Tax=Gigaspora margarita TaxID=4874 RepID=A0ABM8VZZ4_GIGMA|nr:12664_t:CDS:2 [Gigaspora margarita]